MKMLKMISVALLTLASAVLIFGGQGHAALAARAQDAPTYKITGVVLDPNESRIVGATIKVENGDFKRKVLSNEEGYFEIELPAGAYHLSVESDGFKKFKRSPFYVNAGASEFLEVRMKLAPPINPIKI